MSALDYQLRVWQRLEREALAEAGLELLAEDSPAEAAGARAVEIRECSTSLD